MDYIPAKHLLHRSRSTEWFGTDHTMNIYRGCCHGCLYCDSRSDCYQIGEFERVRAKADALHILRDDLARKVRPAFIGMGSMSDPYNPFEEELQLTRHALELIDAYSCGVTIATKSDLIVRDMDILTAIRGHSPVVCKLTVTTADDALAAKLEPNAPSPSCRLAALEKLSGAGLFAGVLLMPVLPFLEDSDDSVLGVVEAAARAMEPGSGGNVPAGSILVMATPPVGVSRCSNPDAFRGGVDTEGDEALRARILETYKRMPNGANAAFYEQGALSFDQVAACTVLPRVRGRGTVDVAVAVQSGLPGEALLQELTEYFQSLREIAVDVLVKAPAVKSVNVTVKVTAKEGAEPAEVKTREEQVIREFFSGERLSENILTARLNSLVFAQEGVANCKITAPTADVAVGAGELPPLGTLEGGGGA